jgi:hypothetical protein
MAGSALKRPASKPVFFTKDDAISTEHERFADPFFRQCVAQHYGPPTKDIPFEIIFSCNRES